VQDYRYEDESIARTSDALMKYGYEIIEKVYEIVELPEWILEEVTNDAKYYNSNLLENPFKNWTISV